jgi:hypothetical protein
MPGNLNCPLCSSSNLKLATNKLRFGYQADVYNCQDCTLTFLDQNSFAYPKRGPSDTLSARQVGPDADLKDALLFERWQGLWQDFNQRYQGFLKNNGFGDRLWRIAERGK